MPYLLDTNVAVGVLRGRNARLIQRVRARPAADLRLCSVVKAELIRGSLRGSRPAVDRARVDAFVRPYLSLSFDDAAAEVQARIRHHLESLGTPIGPYDLQIASIALVHGLTVVTHNVGEFGRVPGLAVEDWEVP
jgi:tRNA(fMet)-specific endonuclease VapC